MDSRTGSDHGSLEKGPIKDELKPEVNLIEGSSVKEIALLLAISKAGAAVARREEGIDGKPIFFISATKEDKTNPRNWPTWQRYLMVILASTLNNIVTIVVSGYSTGIGLMDAEFGVSAETGIAGLTLFILGFALGPMVAAPASEFFGRRPVYLITWALFTIFQLPIALAKNIETVLIFRFLGGFVGSVPLANTGGVVHDLFGRDAGGYAVAIYALSSTDGPPFGNAVSGYIAQIKGWRWLFWFFLIISAAFWFMIYFFLPETRETILMMKKTKKLREETEYEHIYALHELDRAGPSRFLTVSLVRPFKFLFTEPITYLCALINGLTYGIIFLANEAFPLVFGGRPGFGLGSTNLTYLAFVLGAIIGFCSQPLQERYYRRATALKGSSDPEARWYSSVFGIWLLPIGLFIAAFTSGPSIIFIAPLVGFTLFGIAFYLIIAAILNYCVDGYGHYSASCLAGVVSFRNIIGAIFPLFAAQMYGKLGNQNATVILACLAILVVPIPFYFFYRGETVRARSPYCAQNFEKDDQ